MDLDDLKKEWDNYDIKLNKTLTVNEDVLHGLNLGKSKREIAKPYIMEVISALTNILVIVFVTAYTLMFLNEPKFLATGLLTILVCATYLSFSVIKLIAFWKIDYYNSSVIKLQRDLASLHKTILSFRKIEMMGIPFLAIGLLPIAFKVQADLDIFNHPILFMAEFGAIFILSSILVYALNKKLYDKKFEKADSLLDDISKFEKE